MKSYKIIGKLTFWEVDILGVDILGVDILGVDILGVDILRLLTRVIQCASIIQPSIQEI